MSRYISRARIALAAALLVPLAVGAVLIPFRTDMSNTHVALVLVVAVVAVAALGSRVAGALAALVAAGCFDFFFTRPYEHFTIDKSTDVATALLLLAVGLAVSQLAARARTLRVIAITNADYLARIRDTSRVTGSATSPDAVTAHVRDELVDVLHLRGCRFEYGSLLGRHRVWNATAAWSWAAGPGTWTPSAGRARRSSCAYSTTGASTAAS
ncbi:DUF4118 domain-containing protein [Yinghuangia sp. ASG 101]|uniref:DUF4118 domain-containing protein n=1 Tax=Yinghuangia sp. ASG 101 TaxID=2896848 RepID=UPI002F914A29